MERIEGFVARPLSEKEHSHLYKLIDYYAVNRTNGDVYFGKDEFLTTESKDAMMEPSVSYVVTTRDDSDRMILGYIILIPSHFCGLNIAPYADVRIVPNYEAASLLPPLAQLLKTAEKLALQNGYEACLVDTFITNTNMVKTLRASGYRPTVILPCSGYVYDIGWQDNIVMIKELKDIRECLPGRPTQPADKVWMKVFQARQYQGDLNLPITFTDNKGQPYLFVAAREEHAQAIHDLLLEAASTGSGYANTTVATVEDILAIIRGEYKGNSVYVVLHPEIENHVVTALLMSPSFHTRSMNPLWCDMYMWVQKEYRGTGFHYSLTTNVSHRLMAHSGYKGSMSDCFIDNVAALRGVRSAGSTLVGVIPYAGYLQNKGWTDSVYLCLEVKTHLAKL